MCCSPSSGVFTAWDPWWSWGRRRHSRNTRCDSGVWSQFGSPRPMVAALLFCIVQSLHEVNFARKKLRDQKRKKRKKRNPQLAATPSAFWLQITRLSKRYIHSDQRRNVKVAGGRAGPWTRITHLRREENAALFAKYRPGSFCVCRSQTGRDLVFTSFASSKWKLERVGAELLKVYERHGILVMQGSRKLR